jgi:hypothetical protein
LAENLANLTPERLLGALKLLQQWVVIYHELAYTQMPVVCFARQTLQLEGPAKEKSPRKLGILEAEL